MPLSHSLRLRETSAGKPQIFFTSLIVLFLVMFIFIKVHIFQLWHLNTLFGAHADPHLVHIEAPAKYATETFYYLCFHYSCFSHFCRQTV